VADLVSGAEILGVRRMTSFRAFIRRRSSSPTPVSPRLGQENLERLAGKLWPKGDEPEPPSQGVVHHRQGTVGGVHHADQMQIVRDVKFLVGVLGVGQRDGVLFPRLSGSINIISSPKILLKLPRLISSIMKR